MSQDLPSEDQTPRLYEVRPEDAAKTYLYLRIGLIGAALLLVVSVGVEILNVWQETDEFCLQPSISAYYYTPVRSVFVGALLMISIALIVIQGDGLEDLWLTLAGMLAPVVALVPTPNAGECTSFAVNPAPKVKGVLAEWVVTIVDNNIIALLIVGGLAWLAAMFMLKAMVKASGKPAPKWAWGGWRTVGAVLLLFTVVFWLFRNVFDAAAHHVSAVFMFVFLYAATVLSARRCDRQRDAASKRYARGYRFLARMMVATVVLVGVVKLVGVVQGTTGWQHWVFTLEATEIFIFATYWIIQTREHRPRSIGELTTG